MVARWAHNPQVGGSNPSLATTFRHGGYKYQTMSNTPKLSIAFSNKNLQRNIANIDGQAGFIGSGQQNVNLNKILVINSLDDAEAKGLTVAREPSAHRHLKEFYDELGGTQEIFLLLRSRSTTMAQMLSVSNTTVAEILATCTVTFTAIGSNGDVITLVDSDGVTLGSYTKVSGDTTNSLVATAVKAAIDALASTTGYSCTRVGAVLTITAPVGSGADINDTSLENTGNNGTMAFTIATFDGGLSAAVVGGKKFVDDCDGKIAHLGIFRKPSNSYNPGTDFIDTDVPAAVTAAKTLCAALNTSLKFNRVYIEGRVADDTSSTIYAPNTAENGYAGVVLGGTVNDGSASVGLFVGRKVKYPAHIKPGKVANGALTASTIYIGTRLLKNVTNLDTLHGKGYISYVTYPGKAGYYFGIDNMASTDDFNISVHGSVMDAAARVAASVFIDELEGEVDTNPNGTITELEAKHLEDKINQQVQVTLGDRISGFTSLVDRTVNVVTTSTTKLKLRVLPKGYNTWIEIDLGLTGG